MSASYPGRLRGGYVLAAFTETGVPIYRPTYTRARRVRLQSRFVEVLDKPDGRVVATAYVLDDDRTRLKVKLYVFAREGVLASVARVWRELVRLPARAGNTRGRPHGG